MGSREPCRRAAAAADLVGDLREGRALRGRPRRVQAPDLGPARRHHPRGSPGGSLMTQFETNRSSSNECGVTLMNNQVGYVVAKVMEDKQDVSIRVLPSMIRVDGINKIDFDYEEIAEALGWDDFGNDDFEEIMSTH